MEEITVLINELVEELLELPAEGIRQFQADAYQILTEQGTPEQVRDFIMRIYSSVIAKKEGRLS